MTEQKIFKFVELNSMTIKVNCDLRFFRVVSVCFSNILGETGLCESTLDCAQPSGIVRLKRGWLDIGQKSEKAAYIIW